MKLPAKRTNVSAGEMQGLLFEKR